MLPGQLVVINAHTLVRRWRSEEEHYTSGLQNAMVLQLTHACYETHDEQLVETFLTLFSSDMRIYYVPRHRMMSIDQVTNPARLFGCLRPDPR